MNFEKILQIVLLIAIVVQFFYSFIIGRKRNKDIGNIIITLKKSFGKQSFILMLILGTLGYMSYAAIKGKASNTALLIIIYLLISIYDFSKLKIVTDKGMANKSLYNKSIYNFVYWEDIVRWEWHPKHPNLLFFTYYQKGKKDRRDWEIPPTDKKELEEILNKYVEHAFIDSSIENNEQESTIEEESQDNNQKVNIVKKGESNKEE